MTPTSILLLLPLFLFVGFASARWRLDTDVFCPTYNLTDEPWCVDLYIYEMDADYLHDIWYHKKACTKQHKIALYHHLPMENDGWSFYLEVNWVAFHNCTMPGMFTRNRNNGDTCNCLHPYKPRYIHIRPEDPYETFRIHLKETDEMIANFDCYPPNNNIFNYAQECDWTDAQYYKEIQTDFFTLVE